MDRDQINQVAHLPPSGRAMGLVHGKVNRVLEKPIIAVNHPFQPCDGIAPPDRKRLLSRAARSRPGRVVVGRGEASPDGEDCPHTMRAEEKALAEDLETR